MNQQQVTTGIVLSRIDYGEADRIISLISPDYGKLRLMAKGVRRVKSKLAGGIELFSVTNLTFIKGRGDIGTLVSSRLITYYPHIVEDIDRTMLGYELIKQLDKTTEDEPEADYFHLLEQTFAALNDKTIPAALIQMWFSAQLLRLSGHTPNLQTELDGTKLMADQTYEFNFDDSVFVHNPQGNFASDQIKFLRIVFSGAELSVITKIKGVEGLVKNTLQLVQFMSQQYIH